MENLYEVGNVLYTHDKLDDLGIDLEDRSDFSYSYIEPESITIVEDSVYIIFDNENDTYSMIKQIDVGMYIIEHTGDARDFALIVK